MSAQSRARPGPARAAASGRSIWATGYRPDYSWLDVPVFDRKGRLRHDGGVVAAPGMYVMGLPFLRRRKSSFIDGAGRRRGPRGASAPEPSSCGGLRGNRDDA